MCAEKADRGTFLNRLRRDRRGNTLALMAAMLVPMAGLAGSAVDTARLYVVKVRLQQACDAAVLAGRKAMIASPTNSYDDGAKAQAASFFNNNFISGWMSTRSVSFAATQTADNQLAGTAQATVPMALMGMFGVKPSMLTVTCTARYDTADTDVMFVLDTTGSMACGPSDPDSCGQATVSYTRPDGTTGYYVQEKSNSRISALRSAVLSFYDTVASTMDSSSHIRYGFVPYTSTVNAGYAVTALSPSYMVSNWTYDTRTPAGDVNNGSTTTTTQNSITQADCNAKAGRTPATGYNTDGSAAVITTNWTSVTTTPKHGTPTTTTTCTITSQPVKPSWAYGYKSLDVSQLITGATITDPTKITGAKVKWQGCLEERDTTATSTFSATSPTPDIDPDLAPTNDSTRWRPMWPDVIYARKSVSTQTGNGPPLGDTAASGSTSSGYYAYADPNLTYLKSGYMVCGKPVQRLATMTRAQVSSYVNASDFVPWGGTYHDTGMIWGLRMISPTGLFATDTAPWPYRGAPNRYIVFMTDGHMATNSSIYGMWGWESYDKRTTGGTLDGDTVHNARFQAVCQAAKNRNITVFVVSLASTLDSSLTSCASPGQAYYASDAASLTTAFQTIARQVAMLRLSQ